VSAYRELPARSSGVAAAPRIPEEHEWVARELSVADARELDDAIASFDSRIARGTSDAVLPFWYDVANARSYRLPEQRDAMRAELANLLRAREIGMPLAEYLARRRARETDRQSISAVSTITHDE
jgi:hypothetical protein